MLRIFVTDGISWLPSGCALIARTFAADAGAFADHVVDRHQSVPADTAQTAYSRGLASVDSMNIAEQTGLRVQNAGYSVNTKERLDFPAPTDLNKDRKKPTP
jgi:hypothetical protein